jgi:hypothetical protein
MTAHTAWRGIVAHVLAFAALVVPARAAPFPECAERAYAQAVAASQEWQHALRDLSVKLRPDLATIATLETERQMALLDRRHAQFRYLLRTDIGRLHPRGGLATFRNFDWKETDARVLRQQSSDYLAIDHKVMDLERQIEGRRDWPMMQDYVRTSLSATPQFQDLLKRLEQREQGIEGFLKNCGPSTP